MALPGLGATQALGARIAASLRVGDAVALEGDRGAGKTTLAHAILHALGVDEEATRRAAAVMRSYETATLNIRHYDLYRIEKPEDVDGLGLDEALDDGAALIEWPERALAWLPPDRLHVALTILGGGRRAKISGPARWAEPMADAGHG